MVILLCAVLLVCPALMIVFICLYSSERKKNKKLTDRVSALEKAVGGKTPVQPAPVANPVQQATAPVNPSVAIPAPNPVVPQAAEVKHSPQTAPGKQVFSYGAPAAQPVQTARPAPAQTVASNQKPKSKNSTINVILIIGVLFIVLSGFIFMTTTWNIISDGMRAAALIMMSVVFFCGSFIAEKMLILKKTGFAFFCLGSAFLPISFFACGLFELFGGLFSPMADNPGKSIFYFATFLIVTLISAVGSVKYSSKFFSWVSYASKTLTFVALVNCFEPTAGARALALSLYGAVIVLLNGKAIEKIEEFFPKFETLLSQYGLFSILNLSAIALVTMFTFESSFVSALAMFVIAASFLTRIINKTDFPAGSVVFVLFIAVGFVKLSFGDSSWDNVIFKLSLSLIVCLALSMMNFIDEKLKKFVRIFTGAASVMFLLGNVGFSTFAFDEASLPLIVSTIIIYLSFVIASISKENKYLVHLHPLAFMTVVFEISGYLIKDFDPQSEIKYVLIWTLASLLGFVIYKLVHFEKVGVSFRTPTADFIFMAMPALSVMFGREYDYPVAIVAGAVLMLQAVISVITNKNGVVKKIAALGVPVALIFSSPVFRLDADELYSAGSSILSSYLIALGLGCVIVALASYFVMKKDENSKAISFAAQIGLPFFAVIHWGLLFNNVYHSLDKMLDSAKPVTISDVKNYYLYVAGLMLFVICYSFGMLFRYLKKSKENGVPHKSLTVYIVSAVFGVSALLSEILTHFMISGGYGIDFGLPSSAIGVVLIAALAFVFDKFANAKDNIDEYIKDRFFKTAMAFSYLSAVALPFFINGELGYSLSDEALMNPITQYNSEVIVALIVLTVISVLSFGMFKSKKETIWCLPLTASIGCGIYNLSLMITKISLSYDRVSYGRGFTIEEDVARFITTVLLVALSYISFSKLYGKEALGEKKKLYIDWFIVSAAFPIICSIDFSTDSYSEYINFAFCILTAFYILSFIKKVYYKASRQSVMTAALIPFCISFWIQPLVELHPAIELEYILLPIAISLVLLYYIWNSQRKVVGIIDFVISAVMIAVLFFDGMDKGYVFDALFLGVVTFLMFIISLVKKHKKWFMLSSVSLVILGVYMTREFWKAIDWWIYLAVIGIVLITLAAVNELARRDGRETLVKKVGRAFDGWEW